MASKYDRNRQQRQSAISSITSDTAALKEAIESGDMVEARLCMDAIKKSRTFWQAAKDALCGEEQEAELAAAWSAYLAAAEPILAQDRAAAARKANAATDAQLSYLGILGWRGKGEELTKQEASQLIDTLKSGRRSSTITAEDNDDPEAFDSVRRAMNM